MEKSHNASVVSPKLLRDQLVTLADLQEFKEALLLSLARLMKENAGKPPKKWLKSREVKAMLNISNGTLYAMRINGSLPWWSAGEMIIQECLFRLQYARPAWALTCLTMAGR
ncbi:DNA-binding protein [Puia dinghuensis]|uniref:DNA-binding protein n=1 Tax=Puia dinghuensis TaxID=1792502 RepID=UPI0016680522|nr:DNA-binding protein [Puia dinghuensis]